MQTKHLPLDLVIIDVLTLATWVSAWAIPVQVARDILGLIFIFFIPGYVLTSVFFPRKLPLETSVRIALSLGLSITTAALLGLILIASPVGFSLNSVFISLSAFIIVASVPAWLLRIRKGKDEANVVQAPAFLVEAIRAFRMAGWGYRSLVIVLICIIISSLGVFGWVSTRTATAQAYSEFYLLDANGKTESYPKVLSVGETATVTLSILSHETREASFIIRVQEGEVETRDFPPVNLKPGERWHCLIPLSFQQSGEKQRATFDLYKDGSWYERLFLWVNVTPGNKAQ